MANTLLWYNAAKAPLQTAVDAAAAAFIRRLGIPPTHVILPLGEYPEMVGKLRVETDRRVRANHLEVYSADD